MAPKCILCYTHMGVCMCACMLVKYALIANVINICLPDRYYYNIIIENNENGAARMCVSARRHRIFVSICLSCVSVWLYQQLELEMELEVQGTYLRSPSKEMTSHLQSENKCSLSFSMYMPWTGKDASLRLFWLFVYEYGGVCVPQLMTIAPFILVYTCLHIK